MPSLGIEQAKAIGLNQVEPEWLVKWVLFNDEIAELDTFFADRAQDGNYFLWKAPASVLGRYRCKAWTKTISNHLTQELEATFVQDHSYALPDFNAKTAIYILGLQFASTRIDRKVSLDLGTFAFTLESATLIKNIPIYPASATYTLQAEPATVLVDRNFAADQQTYSVQGGDTVFFYSGGYDYYSNMNTQLYTFLRDFSVDWWGD
jgi:phage-related protein